MPHEIVRACTRVKACFLNLRWSLCQSLTDTRSHICRPLFCKAKLELWQHIAQFRNFATAKLLRATGSKICAARATAMKMLHYLVPVQSSNLMLTASWSQRGLSGQKHRKKRRWNTEKNQLNIKAHSSPLQLGHPPLRWPFSSDMNARTLSMVTARTCACC